MVETDNYIYFSFISSSGLICRGEGVLPGSLCSGFLFKKRKLHCSQEGFVSQAPHGPTHLSQLPPRSLRSSSNGTNHGTEMTCFDHYPCFSHSYFFKCDIAEIIFFFFLTQLIYYGQLGIEKCVKLCVHLKSGLWKRTLCWKYWNCSKSEIRTETW